METKYQKFKYAHSALQKLQQFKKPFTKFFDEIVYSNADPTEICEYYLLQDSEEEFEFIDLEIETTAHKLARLLELKEQLLKQDLL